MFQLWRRWLGPAIMQFVLFSGVVLLLMCRPSLRRRQHLLASWFPVLYSFTVVEWTTQAQLSFHRASFVVWMCSGFGFSGLSPHPACGTLCFSLRLYFLLCFLSAVFVVIDSCVGLPFVFTIESGDKRPVLFEYACDWFLSSGCLSIEAAGLFVTATVCTYFYLRFFC